jgi:hypothetical protein
MVVRFAHPVLERTIRVNLGAPGKQAQDKLDALNRIFLDPTQWYQRHDDAPGACAMLGLGQPAA